MTLREIFATNLKSLRQVRKLTQEELADLADIDRTYVSLLERSQYSASLDMLEKLATALAAEPSKMISLNAYPEQSLE